MASAWCTSYASGSGGPAGTLYSFIIVWAGNLAMFASLTELASVLGIPSSPRIIEIPKFLLRYLPQECNTVGFQCLHRSLVRNF